jgi:hypothetical protein
MINIDFTLYEKTKYIIIAMLALKAEDELEEKEVILAALDNNHNIEVNYLFMLFNNLTDLHQ